MTKKQDKGGPWPVGGGRTGDLIRSFDWAATSVGPIDAWPAHLRYAVDTLVNSPIPKVLMWGPDHVMIYNDGYIEIAGARHPAALGGTVAGIWPEIWYWNRRILEAGLRGEVQAFRDQSLDLERNGVRETVSLDLFYTPIHDEAGIVSGVLCTVLDNTGRRRAEEARAAANGRFQAAVDAVHGVLWTNDAQGRMRGPQPGWAALTGQAQAQYEGYGWLEAVHPDDRGPTLTAWEAAVAAPSVFTFEHRLRRHDDQWRRFAIRAVPILNGDTITEWVGLHQDVTEQRETEAILVRHAEDLETQVRHRAQAEERLRHLNETLESRIAEALTERRNAERALHQAQKLETIGKLTGGVAHDFNNLLQVVSGNLQLLSKDVVGNARAERRIANAMAGVARGAKLASQLLAFGRKQPLEPKVVNISRFVQSIDDMLRRAIGEAIEVETIVGGGLWNTFIDPAQIENAVLNLAINARDAMNGEGRLTVELGNASLDDAYARVNSEAAPGQYVMLAVSDTGAGIAPDIMDKVFEPFFSTKAEGRGSGLGLSMVYGFVRQSGGHVKIYSEVGHGTTVKLYLPRARQAEDVEIETEAGTAAGGTETVLVVEDDADVRATVVEMLSDLGYTVLKAVDAQSGLSVVESGIPIDLLFTDVVMPGTLKSPELARMARHRLPKIAVLFTSGYTENSIVHGGRLDDGVHLLSKPYTREDLARKVRHVLANQKQREGAGAQPAALVAERLTVLLVEDDRTILSATADMLKHLGHVVAEAASAEDAMMALQTLPIDVLVTDVHLPGLAGPDLARYARGVRPGLAVVFATGDAEVPLKPEEAVGTAVLHKPYSIDGLAASLATLSIQRDEPEKDKLEKA